MIDFRITMRGTAPLLMHNSRLANPLDPIVKEMQRYTAKRKKTDDDRLEIAHLEFLGGLYVDADLGPYLPGENAWRCLYDAAKKHKLGPRIKEGVVITTDVNPLSYRGPRTGEELWADENFRHMASVKNQMNRIMRMRPIFRTWAVEVDGVADPNILDWGELDTIVSTASQLIGVGDWRPRYGRFDVELDKL